MKEKIFFILMVFLAFSCKKNNDAYLNNPDWLNDKIAQMDTVDYYFGTKIYLYEWHRAYYYWISIPISSCMMCEFYNYQGVKQVWTQNNIDDFQKNAIKKKVVWQRDII
jgi:hypothetical protein